jgi:hypothetical protein
VTLGATLSESLSSFTTARHVVSSVANLRMLTERLASVFIQKGGG